MAWEDRTIGSGGLKVGRRHYAAEPGQPHAHGVSEGVGSRRFGLSILTKIFLGFAAVIASFGGLAAYLEVQSQRAVETLRLVVQDYVGLSHTLHELEASHRVLQTFLSGDVGDLGDRSGVARQYIQSARTLRPRFISRAREAIVIIQGRDLPPSEPAYLAGMDRQLARVARAGALDEPLFEQMFARLDARDPVTATESRKQLARREALIEKRFKAMGKSISWRMRELSQRVAAQQERSRSNLLGLVALASAVALLVWILVFRTLSPIRRMRETAAAVARGDLQQRVAIRRNDELGTLAEEFDRMTDALVARDERLHAQAKELIAAERLATIGKMAAHITHEVRNPLSSIGLNTELLAEELERLGPDAAEARALVAAIGRVIDRLGDITEQYLRFARLPAPRRQPEDLSELVRSVADFVRPEVESAGLVLEVDAPPMPAVPLDEGQIRQVLVNLLRNAREATARGGRIRLATRTEGDVATLLVSDTGAGVSREVVPQIFDTFFTTKEHGTGLGLPLVRQIVLAHGGTIEVDSAPGQGTTFLVRLPVTAPAAPASTDEAPQPAAGAR
jgi:two-component system, NtrC family, sensor kinase